ncbi:hypothetical protein BH09MYX1_BH09MYX1_36430 [soil metagenome]
MIDLELGPDVIEKLLPHRRPFLMIDGTIAYERRPRPRLRACRHVSANEPVFEGHLPGLHLWPGVYTIEGMGQTGNLLAVLDAIVEGHEAKGGIADDALEGLRNLERGCKMQPGFDVARAESFLTLLGADGLRRGGMSAAVDVKLVQPAFAGQRIDFDVTLTHRVDRLLRFEVHAEVRGRTIAHGAMSAAIDLPPLPRR